MAKEFKLPNLGEQVESGDLIKIMVSTGDSIIEDQPVLEMETDKADFEVPSDVSGTVKEIHVKEGDTVKVGQLVFTLDDGSGEPDGEEGKKEKKSGEKPDKEPDAGGEKEEDRELEKKAGEMTSGKKTKRRPAKKGASEKQKEEVEDIEGNEDKENKEKAEDGVEGGREKEEAEAESGESKVTDEEEISSEPETEPGDMQKQGRIVPAGPSVRRLARELGVEIGEVRGSGPGGRISIEDVKVHVRRILEKGPQGHTQAQTLPDFSRWGGIRREPMSRIRRQTAKNVSFSWSSIPHVTQCDMADITELDGAMKRYKGGVDEAGGKLTLTAIAVRIAASALARFPRFGSTPDIASREIIYKNYFHIGVAVNTDRGLLVPVIRNVDRKNIRDISVELSRLAENTRNRKLKPEDMEGGVFTVTNLGGIGGTQFSPIVPAPQVAILGISRARKTPVFMDGELENRLVLPLSLSYDHRVIDGADAARFLRWMAEALETPFLSLLEG
jgi:pyruvate dehydrogenase E2 component (dihydrolipoamide acetyltransferase)